MKPIESLTIYPKYPPKAERVIGEHRYNKNGVLGKWNGKNYVPVYVKKAVVSPKIKECECNPSQNPLQNPNNMVYSRLPRVVTQRVIGKSYLNTKNEIVIWNGKLVNCEHNKQKGVCEICKPFAHFAHMKKIKLNYELTKRCKNKPLNPNKYLPDFGCNLEKILTHIESKFEIGMSWENRKEWDIDHRKPIYSFDLSLPNDVKRCFHYTNLQPLWRVKNQSKGKKFDQKTFGWEWKEDIGWVEKKVVQNKHTITAYFAPLKN